MATKKVAEQEVPVIPQEIEKALLGIEMLKVEDLIIDSNYQRDVIPDHVNKMVLNWNWLAAGNLTVSLRATEEGNRYAVIDGQQRFTALKRMGYKEVPCRIFIDLTEEQEARLFEILNTSRKPGFNDLFKSRLARNEEVAHNIEVAVQQIGYKLDPERRHTSNQKSPGNHWYIQTMAELERIYNMGGSILIMDTLRLYRDFFGGEHVGQQQTILAGIAMFLKTYKDVKKTELVQKVKKVGQDKAIQMAYQWQAVHGRSGVRGVMFCEALLNIYNMSRQESNRLKSKYL